MKLPRLLFKNEELADILNRISDENSLIITDEYNFEIVKKLRFRKKKIICIDKALREEIKKVKNEIEYTKVIGIGGCSALDFARACSRENNELYAIPSILSTACISVNKSILYENNHHIVEFTVPPKEVIISWPLITGTEPDELKKWSSSGFGDLFAKISAIIDFLYKEKNIKKGQDVYSLIKKFIKKNNLIDLLEIVNWVNYNFQEYNKYCLRNLAIWLYRAGLETMQSSIPSTAGEHELYYIMLEQQKYNRKLPTHGQLVSIGTLITAKIIEKKLGEKTLFNNLKKVYKKLGLPTTYEDLNKIHVERSHIITGIKSMKEMNFFLNIFFDEKLLDETYEE